MNAFEIISKLGEGSYSVVYKVKRKTDSKIYALKKVRLKKLSDKEKENSLNEVRILASVKSPYVVSYKEAFMDETLQNLCIIMEFADNGDLYQKITEYRKKNFSFNELDIWKIFIQMTIGLKSLHDLNILHRDLKSANVFLFNDGTAKIGDLNVSKVAYRGVGYTQTGTPYYASPEVWNDEAYDNKSDIWSLGCVVYEMLTLYPPFRAETMDGLYKKVIKGKYPKINEKYSKDMEELIKLLLKRNPKERLSCDEILKLPIVVKKIEFFKSSLNGKEENFDEYNKEDNELLKTIRIPKNLMFLKDKLPKANYEKTDPNFSGENNNNDKEKKVNTNVLLPYISQIYKVRNDTEVFDNNNNILVNNNKNNNMISERKDKDILDSNRKNSPKRRFDYNSPSPLNINKIKAMIRSPGSEKMLLRNQNKGSKCSILNKDMLELYKLYVSNDIKKIDGNERYKQNNYLYAINLPHLYLKRDGSSRIINNKIIPNKKLNPING